MTPTDEDVKRFYASSSWQRFRAMALRHHPLCAFCRDRAEVKEAKAIDHVLEVRTHWERRFELANTRGLCLPCHNERRRLDRGGTLKGCGADGEPFGGWQA